MPKRIPAQSIVVMREDKQFRPPIGKPFEFTAEELTQLEESNPAALVPKDEESSASLESPPATERPGPTREPVVVGRRPVTPPAPVPPTPMAPRRDRDGGL